jgi:hypothetical protein
MVGWFLAFALAALPESAAAGEARYRIAIEPARASSGWPAFQRWYVRIRTMDGFAPRIRELRFQARHHPTGEPLPAAPRVSAIGPGLYAVDAAEFGKSGVWQLEARVRDDEGWESAIRTVRAEPRTQ